MTRPAGSPSALQVVRALSFAARLRGWLGRRSIEPNEALWLEPCAAVHGIGMRVSLDVVFLDAQRRVLRVATLAPGRMRWCQGARVSIELAAGAAQVLGIRVGEQWPDDLAPGSASQAEDQL